jgi:hypothetical protein
LVAGAGEAERDQIAVQLLQRLTLLAPLAGFRLQPARLTQRARLAI